MGMIRNTLDALNIKKACEQYRVRLWQCPQFLFIVMGFIIILAIIITNITARVYTEPGIAALIVLVVSAFLFVVGTVVVRAFEEVALSSLAKSEFISIVSHEMRNPLSTVKWQINLLEKLLEEIKNEELKESIATINDQNSRAIRLVNELIEVYRVEDKKLTLNPAPFSLPFLTEDAVKGVGHYARALNIAISLMEGGNLPLVFADKKKVEMVVGHLLNNAIQYSEGGGVISITMEKRGNFIMWTIMDQGVGIPKKDLELLFGRFFRSHNKLRYHTGGLGLGLFLARALIKASGGRVGIHSVEGRGTTVWFTLPINPLEE